MAACGAVWVNAPTSPQRLHQERTRANLMQYMNHQPALKKRVERGPTCRSEYSPTIRHIMQIPKRVNRSQNELAVSL
jgi:hypothetical protein